MELLRLLDPLPVALGLLILIGAWAAAVPCETLRKEPESDAATEVLGLVLPIMPAWTDCGRRAAFFARIRVSLFPIRVWGLSYEIMPGIGGLEVIALAAA